MTYEEVITEYAVSKEQILAALTYFSELLNCETIYPMEKVSWNIAFLLMKIAH